jgi:clan AA aspartic protease (TIGR02281 family)
MTSRATRAGAARALLLLGLLALGACAGGAGGGCGLVPAATLAMAPGVPLPVVDVSIDGKPARMVLDTGAQGVFLMPEAAERLGLHQDPLLRSHASGIGGSVEELAVMLDRVQLGTAALEHVPAAVLQQSLRIAGPVEIDGLLGMSVLDRYDVEIDMNARRAVLYAGRACEAGPPQWQGMQRIEARSLNGSFVIPVRLDGRDLQALIDTGAQADVLFTDAGGIAFAQQHRMPGRVLRGVGPNLTDAFIARFDALEVGDEVLRGVPVVVTQQRPGTPDMILGQSFLARHRVWFSAQRRALFVAQNLP